MPGPDLPEVHELFSVDAYMYRWPSVLLNEDRGIEIHPASDAAPRTVYQALLERQAQHMMGRQAE